MNGRRRDPIGLEVFRNGLATIAEDMGEVMQRAALSIMIKERNDRSCALFNPKLELIAQAEHLPIHLALLVAIVPAAVNSLEADLQPGDICIHNDPYVGGSHLPDITLIAPIYDEKNQALLGYCAVIAHMADIGGSRPGGLGGLSHDIVEEGLIIPPVLLYRANELDSGIMRVLTANVRLRSVFEGDLLAQVAALRAGIRGVQRMVDKLGLTEYLELSQELLDYSAERTRDAISRLPDGRAAFEDFLDDDGQGSGPLPIRAMVTIHGSNIDVDFEGTAPQRRAPVNASLSVVKSAVFFAVRCIIDSTIPTTAGCFRSISISAPPASIVNAEAPAPVAGGSLETAQRVVDTLFGALSKILKDVIPAAGMGSHNSIAFGGVTSANGERFVLGENLSGGSGARPLSNGFSARRVNLMNSPNTPVEVIEQEYPIQIVRSELRNNSFGDGSTRGGLGIRREYLFLEDVSVSILSDRSTIPPWGLAGGTPAKGSRHTLIRKSGEIVPLPSKVDLRACTGDRLVAETAGGGGYGDPRRRREIDIADDVLNDYLAADEALNRYGYAGGKK